MKNQEKKVILVVDYGRSGQGWLSYMLCYILNAKYIEPYDFLKGILYTDDKEIRVLTSGDLPDRNDTQYSMIIKTHELPAVNLNLTDKIIFLTRDPRDVAVSAYFMYRINAKEEKYKSIKSKISYLIHRFKFTSFILTALRWKRFYKAWTEKEKISFHRVKYEDVSTKSEEELVSMLNYLEVKVPSTLIQEAIQKFSFEKLSGRKKGEESIASRAFRKGIIGDYKNHFSKIDLMVFNFICGKEMKKADYLF